MGIKRSKTHADVAFHDHTDAYCLPMRKGVVGEMFKGVPNGVAKI